MALVAYDNSDSSEYEDEDTNTPVTVTILTKKSEEQNAETAKEIESNEVPNLFNILPQPLTKRPAILEEDDEFLHKKEIVTNVKPKAKIMVPSLKDFKDVENNIPNTKPRSSNGKPCGLLSILPQPRNGVKATTKSLIPQVVAQKSNNPTQKKVALPRLKPEIDKKHLNNDYSDDSDHEDVETDFFSINKPKPVFPIDDTPLDIDIKEVGSKKTKNIESYFKKDTIDYNMEVPVVSSSTAVEYSSESNLNLNNVQEIPESNNAVLDEEAIMKLCGVRGKRKREEIQIVDVNQQDVLADAREWLLKGLMDDTTKRVSTSKRGGNEPTSQQKRKHQITYLAHQAKANEAELQNQWANNRMSKRQTQSKYGF